MGRRWILPAAIIVVCCLLMPYLWHVAIAMQMLVAACAISCIVLLAGFFQGKLRKDRYDLDALRRLDEEEEVASLDPGVPAEDADRVVCVHCGNHYHPRFQACPRCGQR